MRATYTQIRAFNGVAREGSFTGAAKHLNLTQPAITLQVRKLENDYGVTLFDRRGQAVSLTTTGRALYSMTHQIHAIEDQVDELLSQQFELVKGELTIASGSAALLMNLVQEFTARYPDIKVSIKLGNWAEVWHMILDRTADVALLTAAPQDHRIQSLAFVRQKVVALISVDHELAGNSSVSPAQLAAENLIARADKSHTQKLVEEMFRESATPLRPILTLDNREALHEAVAANLGIGFVLHKEVGADTRVRALEIADNQNTCVDSVICYKTQARRRVVKAFFEVAKELRSTDIAQLRG